MISSFICILIFKAQSELVSLDYFTPKDRIQSLSSLSYYSRSYRDSINGITRSNNAQKKLFLNQEFQMGFTSRLEIGAGIDLGLFDRTESRYALSSPFNGQTQNLENSGFSEPYFKARFRYLNEGPILVDFSTIIAPKIFTATGATVSSSGNFTRGRHELTFMASAYRSFPFIETSADAFMKLLQEKETEDVQTQQLTVQDSYQVFGFNLNIQKALFEKWWPFARFSYEISTSFIEHYPDNTYWDYGSSSYYALELGSKYLLNKSSYLRSSLTWGFWSYGDINNQSNSIIQREDKGEVEFSIGFIKQF